MEIHNAKLIGNPIFVDGSYGVINGYIDTETRKNDVPHYLIVNLRHEVIEGSASSLFEARGQCSYFNHQLEAQDTLLKKGETLFAEVGASDKSNWN